MTVTENSNSSIEQFIPSDPAIQSEFVVGNIDWQDQLKLLSLKPGRKRIYVPRSACVSTGDRVRLSDQGMQGVCKNGNTQLLPSYVALEQFSIGNLVLEFVIKEITEPEEHIAYNALAQSHYRSQPLHGRTARLVIRNFHPIYPNVVGYIELATPLYMNKPRSVIFNAPFCHRETSWETWDKDTLRQHIHLVVRVARCVIYPEFRGLGLGQMLLKHAMDFARDRWQVAGLKPYFVEISADMLKFVPFARSAGMTFIGETEGNLQRVAKDMAYLLKNRQRIEDGTIVKEDACGIVDQQVNRMSKAIQVMEEQGWNLDDLVDRLSRLSTTAVLRDFNILHGIVTLPKPTYMKGLTPETDGFIKRRVGELGITSNCTITDITLEPIADAIYLENVSFSYQSRVRRTQQTHAIQQAFGISPDDISQEVIRGLTATIPPGSVILLTGPSGSGKSTLLRLFAEGRKDESENTIRWPANYSPGVFSPIRSQKALIETLSDQDVQKALRLMGMVGLSDAFVYLKRFDELSTGQQHRAMLAKLIASGNNVWLADEFCASLDTITSNLVASRLQATARTLGATLIVASSQPESFLCALKPDLVFQLTSAWQHRCIQGSEFMKAMINRSASYSAPYLRIASEFIPDILAGRKRSTIRKGRRTIPTGLLVLKTENVMITVNVIRTKCCHLKSLTEEEAREDGFDTLNSLQTTLRKFYPDIAPTSWVTVIRFDTVCNTVPI